MACLILLLNVYLDLHAVLRMFGQLLGRFIVRFTGRMPCRVSS